MNLYDHLVSRKMNPALYNLILDEDERVVTFLLYNLSGKLVGYQQYRPDQTSKKELEPKNRRYFTHSIEPNGVFGLENLNENDRTIYIVEGVFKAGTLHRLGYNAVAVLTSTPKHLKAWFYIMSKTWNLVAIGDPDAAGQKLVNTVGKGACSPLDLDEMPDDDVKNFLRARV